LFCALLLSGISHAATITVCSSGCNSTTVQEGINAASPYDTVSISGTFFEHVTVNVTGLRITGGGLTARWSAACSGSCPPQINITKSNVEVSGVTLSNSNNTMIAHSIYGNSIDNITISGNSISSSYADLTINGGGTYGIYIINVTNITVSGNTILTGGGNDNDGVVLSTCSNVTIYGNTILVYGGGSDPVYLSSCNYGNVSSNTMTSSWQYSLTKYLLYLGGSHFTVRGNGMSQTGTEGSVYGIYVGGTNNMIYENTISAVSSIGVYGIYMGSGSDSNTISNNTITASNGNFATNPTAMWLGSRYNNISFNRMSVSSTSGTARGIWMSSGSDNLIDNNTISTSGSGSTGSNTGIRCSGSNVTITRNSIYTSTSNTGANNWGIDASECSPLIDGGSINTGGTNSNHGIYFSIYGSGGTISNIRIVSGGSGTANHGLGSVAGTVYMTNSTIITNSSSSYAIEVLDSGWSLGRANISDSVISSSASNDIRVAGGTVSLFNTSVNESDFSVSGNGNITVYRRLDVVVQNISGRVDGSTVSGYDTSSNSSQNPTRSFSSSASSQGTVTHNVTSFRYNSSGYTQFGNYTINATKTGYFTDQESMNLTGYTYLVLDINAIPNVSTIFGRGQDSYDMSFDRVYGKVYAYVNSNNISYNLSSGWSHVAMTFDSGSVKLYINGQLVGTGNTSATLNDNGRSVILGNGTDLTIDEVAFRSGALTQAAIGQHYQVGPGLKAIVSAVGSGSFGRDFDISASTSEGSFSNRHVTAADLLAGTTQSVVLPNVTGVPATIVVTSNSCNQVLTATKAQLSGVYC